MDQSGILVGIAIVAALHLYALTGGADFGGGVWDLLAAGPRAEKQRQAIHEAIAPIWEANHVWMIVVVVLLFSAFPAAFAVLMTVLHIPIALMLGGIVLRGSAFAFRSYGIQTREAARRFGRVFAVTSAVTPVMLGVVLGASISGRIPDHLDPGSGLAPFFTPWLAPFPWVLGGFVLALFANLAAIYLCVELPAGVPEGSPSRSVAPGESSALEDAGDSRAALREDFRRRALASGVVCGLLAWAGVAAARRGAPEIYAGIMASHWALPFQLTTGLVAAGALAALWRRRFRLARLLAITQVSLVVWGWGAAQYPYLVVPGLRIDEAAAEEGVLRPILLILLAGSVILLPAFGYLFIIFKRREKGV